MIESVEYSSCPLPVVAILASWVAENRVARWPGTKVAKFCLKSCQKLPNRFFLTMTSQNYHACVLRQKVSYSCP